MTMTSKRQTVASVRALRMSTDVRKQPHKARQRRKHAHDCGKVRVVTITIPAVSPMLSSLSLFRAGRNETAESFTQSMQVNVRLANISGGAQRQRGAGI